MSPEVVQKQRIHTQDFIMGLIPNMKLKQTSFFAALDAKVWWTLPPLPTECLPSQITLLYNICPLFVLQCTKSTRNLQLMLLRHEALFLSADDVIHLSDMPHGTSAYPFQQSYDHNQRGFFWSNAITYSIARISARIAHTHAFYT